MRIDRSATTNTGLAKDAIPCSEHTFVVYQSLALRINICGEHRHLRQAPISCLQGYDHTTV